MDCVLHLPFSDNPDIVVPQNQIATINCGGSESWSEIEGLLGRLIVAQGRNVLVCIPTFFQHDAHISESCLVQPSQNLRHCRVLIQFTRQARLALSKTFEARECDYRKYEQSIETILH